MTVASIQAGCSVLLAPVQESEPVLCGLEFSLLDSEFISKFRFITDLLCDFDEIRKPLHTE